MTSLCPEEFNISIIEDGFSARDFMNQRIEELDKAGNRDAFHTADLDNILEKHLRWVENLPRVVPFYAVKCNNSRPILALLANLGACFDCASQSEIQQILSLGVTPDRIIYANPCKQESHIKYACIHGIQMMTFDSEDELDKISRCHDNGKLVLRIGVDDSRSFLRLNSKFGARLQDCCRLLERARELCLEVVGVSFHVGSGCRDPQAFRDAISASRRIFNMGIELGFKMNLLDIGGGYPGSKTFNPKFEEFADVIKFALNDFFPDDTGVQVIAEPGRYYVASACTLAVNVIGKKVLTDKSSNKNADDDDIRAERIIMYYVNDGIYGSFNCILFEYELCFLTCWKKQVLSGHKYPSIIWGQTCDSLDNLVEHCVLPELETGDWLLVDEMGAYTSVVATKFNGFKEADTHFVMTQASCFKVINGVRGIGPLNQSKRAGNVRPSFNKSGARRQQQRQQQH
ncbi:ornithine decarboxylase-like [Chanos chanos]|uniref:ornithine decarboxylase n=1 Tax=Chanos chanos TaxID=29144 RepID=A0A6J2V156_CHACN|nr:ornithine decarboxylase-like [Chanos chanos]